MPDSAWSFLTLVAGAVVLFLLGYSRSRAWRFVLWLPSVAFLVLTVLVHKWWMIVSMVVVVLPVLVMVPIWLVQGDERPSRPSGPGKRKSDPPKPSWSRRRARIRRRAS